MHEPTVAFDVDICPTHTCNISSNAQMPPTVFKINGTLSAILGIGEDLSVEISKLLSGRGMQIVFL